jgi:tetratricopeptide (TPR) repeat protein
MLVDTPRHVDTPARPLQGCLVVFAGKLLTLARTEAQQLARHLGAEVCKEVTGAVTVCVAADDGGGRRKRVDHINAQAPDRIRVLTEDQFCELADVPSPTALRAQYHSRRDLLERYRHLRGDHLEYLQKWGLVQPVYRTHAEAFFAFQDLAVIRQAEAELASGASFRTVLRSLVAASAGQRTFDFRLDAQPARVVELKPKVAPPMAAMMGHRTDGVASQAEELFLAGSILDTEGPQAQMEAAEAYRRALELDPNLVPALVNLANIHYSRDEGVEAQALYERATSLDPDMFEAHYNLGNIHHDLGRYPDARASYREAIRLNPGYADAHFYLAVTLEKAGQSTEARPHWKVYQHLAPAGEWVELAREFSE